MDRITKAIELAKERNQLKADTASGSTRKAAIPAAAPANTRSVEISPEHLRQQGIISHFQDEHFSDAYRLLRTRVLQRMRQNGWHTLGVTSTDPKEGKSFTSINLSIAIALDQNHSSLLIDADMRRPSVHEYLGFTPDIGIAEYLQRDIALNDVTCDPGIEDFLVLPCVKSVEGTSELLGGPRMAALIDELKGANSPQITIFDMPPIHVGDDVVTLASKLDAVLVVVEDGSTQSDDLRKSMAALKEMNVLGTVLNKASEVDTQKYGGYY